MPGPPPNGASSTERCLSRANPRRPTSSNASPETGKFLIDLVEGDLSAERVLSSAQPTICVIIQTASLAVNSITQGLALARAVTSALLSNSTASASTSR
jgi:hypothetical protein